MVTKRRKADRRLIRKRKSTVGNERLAKGENTSEISEYSFRLLRENDVSYTQQEEDPDNGRADYGREASYLGHKVSKNLLSTYLRELGRIPLLTVEEEKALAKEIQERQRDLVHRLLKLDLEIDEIDILIRRQWNISDELLAAIVGKVEKLEEENRTSPHKKTLLSQIKNLYVQLRQLKGEMLKRNLRLVVKIAKEYKHSGISLWDLVQEGNLGLMRAVTKFDYRRGYKFSTYATWWIRQAILRAIVEKERTIRIPRHLMERRQKLTKTYGNLLRKRGKSPQPGEIAKKAKLPLKAVYRTLFFLPETVSLQSPIGEDSSLEYFIEDEESPSPLEVMERKEVRQMAEKMLSHLPARETEILRLRFGIGGEEEHTLEQIGRKFGISRERVRQLERKGIDRLRYLKKGLAEQVEKTWIRKTKRNPGCQTSMSKRFLATNGLREFLKNSNQQRTTLSKKE